MNRNKCATHGYTLFFNPRAETNEEHMNIIIHPLIHERKQARYQYESHKYDSYIHV